MATRQGAVSMHLRTDQNAGRPGDPCKEGSYVAQGQRTRQVRLTSSATMRPRLFDLGIADDIPLRIAHRVSGGIGKRDFPRLSVGERVARFVRPLILISRDRALRFRLFLWLVHTDSPSLRKRERRVREPCSLKKNAGEDEWIALIIFPPFQVMLT